MVRKANTATELRETYHVSHPPLSSTRPPSQFPISSAKKESIASSAEACSPVPVTFRESPISLHSATPYIHGDWAPRRGGIGRLMFLSTPPLVWSPHSLHMRYSHSPPTSTVARPPLLARFLGRLVRPRVYLTQPTAATEAFRS
jgi:hypothetical protein